MRAMHTHTVYEMCDQFRFSLLDTFNLDLKLL